MAINFDVDAAFAKLGQLVAHYGPTAYDASVNVVQMDALSSLLSCIPFFLGALFVLFLQFKFRAWVNEDWDDFDKAMAPIPDGFLTINMIVLVMLGFWRLVDVWSWVGLFNPKLALAHDIMMKIL